MLLYIMYTFAARRSSPKYPCYTIMLCNLHIIKYQYYTWPWNQAQKPSGNVLHFYLIQSCIIKT